MFVEGPPRFPCVAEAFLASGSSVNLLLGCSVTTYDDGFIFRTDVPLLLVWL